MERTSREVRAEVQAFRTFAFLVLCATLVTCQTGTLGRNEGVSARVT
jgi:hypothetical protein